LRIIPLDRNHSYSSFNCQNSEIDKHIRKNALDPHESFLKRTQVVVKDNSVIGFYSLEPLTFQYGGTRKKTPPLQVIYLTYLAVHKDNQRQGVGTALLTHAIDTTKQIGQLVGISGLYLDPINDEKAKFYKTLQFEEVKLVGKLKPGLLLLIKTISAS
jgi:GNAT superfamily N-acetyltransferase